LIRITREKLKEGYKMNVSFQGVEKQAEDFLNTLKCRVQKPYPQTKLTFKDVQLAEKLLSAFADGGNSELSALTQYFIHSQTIDNEEVKNLLYCVSMNEMYHLEVLSEMITSLGGEPRYWGANHAYWTGGYVEYGTNASDKLSADIFSEQEAIAGYEALLRDIKKANNPNYGPVEAVINRIIEDENYHITLFSEAYASLPAGT
jgi:rubrerythrin